MKHRVFYYWAVEEWCLLSYGEVGWWDERCDIWQHRTAGKGDVSISIG